MDRCEIYENAGTAYLEPKIIKSLTKSRVRRSILLYLYTISPLESYVAEIARNINAKDFNVIGGIKGTDNRYSNSYSLLQLEIIIADKNEDGIFYKLSEKGIKVAENILKIKGLK